MRRILEVDKIKQVIFNEKQLDVLNLCNTRMVDIYQENYKECKLSKSL
jgi:hypothetical protein